MSESSSDCSLSSDSSDNSYNLSNSSLENNVGFADSEYEIRLQDVSASSHDEQYSEMEYTYSEQLEEQDGEVLRGETSKATTSSVKNAHIPGTTNSRHRDLTSDVEYEKLFPRVGSRIIERANDSVFNLEYQKNVDVVASSSFEDQQEYKRNNMNLCSERRESNTVKSDNTQNSYRSQLSLKSVPPFTPCSAIQIDLKQAGDNVENISRREQSMVSCKERFEIEEIFVSRKTSRVTKFSNKSNAHSNPTFTTCRSDQSFEQECSRKGSMSLPTKNISKTLNSSIEPNTPVLPKMCPKSHSYQTSEITKPNTLMANNRSFPYSEMDKQLPSKGPKLLKPKKNTRRNMKVTKVREYIGSESKGAGEIFNPKQKSRKSTHLSRISPVWADSPKTSVDSEVSVTAASRVTSGRYEPIPKANAHMKPIGTGLNIPKRTSIRHVQDLLREMSNTNVEKSSIHRSDPKRQAFHTVVPKESELDLRNLISNSSCSTISSIATISSDVSLGYRTHEVKNPFLKKKLTTEYMFENLDGQKFGLLKRMNPAYREVDSAYETIIHLMETDMASCAIKWFLFKEAVYSRNVGNIVPFPQLFFKNNALDVKYMERFVQLNSNLNHFSTDDSLSIQLIHWALTVSTNLEFLKYPKSSCGSILAEVSPIVLSLVPHFMFSLKRSIPAEPAYKSGPTLFCPAPLHKVFTIVNDNLNALMLNYRGQRGVFGFNSIKKCIKFITNESININSTTRCATSDSSSNVLPNMSFESAKMPRVHRFETFVILIIEVTREVNPQDIFQNKSCDSICFIKNPYDVIIRHVLLYEAGTFEKMRNISKKSSVAEEGEDHEPPVDIQRNCGDLTCHLLILLGLILFTMALVYYVYVKSILLEMHRRKIELELKQSASKKRAWGKIWRLWEQ